MKTRIASTFFILTLGCLAVLISSCARGPIGLRFGGDDPQPNLESELGEQKIENQISFEEVSQAVFFNEQGGRCNKCHDNDEPPNLTTYNQFKAELIKIKRTVIDERKMPKRRQLTAEQYELVRLWVAQGGPEKGRPFGNVTTTTTTTTTSTSTSTSTTTSTTLPAESELIGWEEISQKIFFNQNAGRCNACHDFDEMPNLTNYREFKSEIESIQKAVVIERSMPRKRKLTEEQISMVKTWIEQGAPEKGRPFNP